MNCGHGQRAEGKGAMISVFRLRSPLTEDPGYCPLPGLFRLFPPGPAVVRLLGIQPGEEKQNSLVQTRVPACPLICSCVQLAFVTCF